MRKFPAFLKKALLFAAIFTLLAGDVCFSQEIRLSTIMPIAEVRIIRGTIFAQVAFENPQPEHLGDGFTVVEGGLETDKGGQYLITFNEAFPSGFPPTVVCTYMPTPGATRSVRVQVRAVTETYADVIVIDKTGHNFASTGAFTFIAIGPGDFI